LASQLPLGCSCGECHRANNISEKGIAKMNRLTAIAPETATGPVKNLFDGVQKKLGMVPNMMRTMAVAPPVLEAYLQLSGALGGGKLPAKLREQIALSGGRRPTAAPTASPPTAPLAAWPASTKEQLARQPLAAIGTRQPRPRGPAAWHSAIVDERVAASPTIRARRRARMPAWTTPRSPRWSPTSP
jgi:hypothetical protein